MPSVLVAANKGVLYYTYQRKASTSNTMLINPLFPKEDDQPYKPKADDGYVLQNRHARTIQPLSKNLSAPMPMASQHMPPTPKAAGSDSAVELIRRKVQSIYAHEPDVREEIAEAVQPAHHPSKHQQFMHKLSTSGKSLAQIQTEWHNYYLRLPDHEKHEVWREFYQANTRQPSAYSQFVQQQPAQPQERLGELPHMPGATSHAGQQKAKAVVAEHATHLPSTPKSNRRAVAHIKKRIVNRVLSSDKAQAKAKQHLHSLAFGLATGFIVLSVLLFSFFNEMVLAPFIQPSRHVSATPIIVSADSVATSPTPEVIIPKINVQIPVVYDEKSVDEAAVQRALERGAIHYPTTVLPGQLGNAAVFGHSSNNILNQGKYKFAFVLLHELVPGDIFYLTYAEKVYTYRVFNKRIVPPTEVSVINNVPGKAATVTLITCDPPGTSTNRLVVWGEQISPDPAGAAAPTTPPAGAVTPTELPSNAPTLWNRIQGWIF
jgi:LPXTG-site transpeptidase (sortase) family protein